MILPSTTWNVPTPVVVPIWLRYVPSGLTSTTNGCDEPEAPVYQPRHFPAKLATSVAGTAAAGVSDVVGCAVRVGCEAHAAVASATMRIRTNHAGIPCIAASASSRFPPAGPETWSVGLQCTCRYERQSSGGTALLRSGVRIDQGEAGGFVHPASKMGRRLGEDHLQGRPYPGLQEMAAMRSALGLPD